MLHPEVTSRRARELIERLDAVLEHPSVFLMVHGDDATIWGDLRHDLGVLKIRIEQVLKGSQHV